MSETPGIERLTASDGHEVDCWIQPAEGKAKGGLVVLQEIFGVTDQLKGVARHYAAQGYDVAIPALFDRRERGAVLPFDAVIKARELMLSLSVGEAMQDVAAATDRVRGVGKVGAIGFCWGGGLAIRAAQVCDIGAAVAFYGTRLDQYLEGDIKAPVQIHFGSADDHVPPEMREALLSRFPSIEAFVYEAGHAFANDARTSYVAAAAETAHKRAAVFLAKTLA